MEELSKALPAKAGICVDVGQHQMWAAQSMVLRKGQRFLTEGGLAAMGSSLPMALGASFAAPGRPLAVVVGDGSFQLNVQELQTLKAHRSPIKVVIINNRCYGMVRQMQKQYFYAKYYSTVLGYSAPDFCAVVKAYGLPAKRIRRTREVGAGLAWLMKAGPRVLEVMVDQDTDVTPKLGLNRPVEDQDPLIPRADLEAALKVPAAPARRRKA